MMVKLWANEDGHDFWVMFDNCSNLKWEVEPLPLKWGDSDVTEWSGQDADRIHIQLSDDAAELGKQVHAAWLRWYNEKDESMHLLVTDSTSIYVLSDGGDTVERVGV